MKTEKNRNFLLVSLFVLLLVGGLLLGLGFATALADEWDHDRDDPVIEDPPSLIDDQATQAAEQSGAENDPGPQESSLNTSAPDPAVTLQTMLQAFENNTFSHTGWLHKVYYQESEVNNGVALPQSYFVDGWYLVNDAGFVTQNVVSRYDDAGNLISRGIYTDNTHVNLTTNERMETEGSYRLKLDGGVIMHMLETHMEGSILIHEETTINEKTVNKFSVIGNYDKPAYYSNSSQPVTSIRMTAIFDQETGAFSETECVFMLIDGTEELFYRVQILTLEWEDLPQEFIQLLEEK